MCGCLDATLLGCPGLQPPLELWFLLPRAGFAAVRPTASAFPSRGIGDLAARLAVQGPGTLGPGGEIGGGVAISVRDEAASIAVEHPLGQLHSRLDGAAPRAGPT